MGRSTNQLFVFPDFKHVFECICISYYLDFCEVKSLSLIYMFAVHAYFVVVCLIPSGKSGTSLRCLAFILHCISQICCSYLFKI